MNPVTTSIMKAVTPRLIAWPRDLAAAETLPESAAITRAGQHHAPIKAGMDISNVQRETITERFDAF